MTGLISEIYGETRENRIDTPDSSKSPTPVHSEAAVRQLHQSFDVAAIQLPGCRHFLEFFSHSISYPSRPSRGTALLKIVSGEKPREIAVQVLGGRDGQAFTEDLLESAVAGAQLSPADRRLAQELVYGVVRWQATLDWLIEGKTGPRTQKVPIQNLLRVGLYQIFWLERIPAHAAVHVIVELAKRRGFGPQSGFINAILRGYLRDFEPTRARLNELKQNQPHLGYSHPEWLVRRWQEQWGQARTAELLEWNNSPAKTFARVNTLKITPEKLLPIWRDEGVDYDFVGKDWFEENLVFELKSHPPLDRLPSFQGGFFYVQDPSTLLAVRELAPERRDTVLDLCAAPGGKLTYMAQLMSNEGLIIGHDIAAERLALLTENCARLGVTCVQTTTDLQSIITPQSALRTPHSEGSALCPPHSEATPQSALRTPHFDRVLLDAPCSNTGVMRRRVDLRWRVTPAEIVRLSRAQLDLLQRAATAVKPGGILVYSTCSLEPEENKQVIESFLARRPEFKMESERVLMPFADGVDGAYVARLRRSA